MTTELALLAGTGFLGVIGLWCLYAIAYRQYRIDLLRQRLFVVRDRLFLSAVRGSVNLHAPAYRMTRQTLNGMIRFAHTFSLTRVIVDRLLQRVYRIDWSNYEEEHAYALRQLEPEARKIILTAYKDAHEALYAHLISISITMMVLVGIRWAIIAIVNPLTRLFLSIWGQGARLAKLVVEWLRFPRFWKRIDAIANYAGCL